MIPIPGFDNIQCNWIAIQREGFVLYGCLLYLASDHYFYEYMNSDGLLDLEHWTGDDLAVFVVQAPSQKWIEYARTENHIWWKLFGKYTEFLQEYQDEAVLQTDKGLNGASAKFHALMSASMQCVCTRRWLRYSLPV